MEILKSLFKLQIKLLKRSNFIWNNIRMHKSETQWHFYREWKLEIDHKIKCNCNRDFHLLIKIVPIENLIIFYDMLFLRILEYFLFSCVFVV